MNMTPESVKRGTITLWVTVLLLGASWPRGVRAESNCPSCDVSAVSRSQYDALLNLTTAQKKTAESTHVPYGLPLASSSASHEHLLHQHDYITWYDDNLRVPLWVAYRLKKINVTTPRERLDCFRPDPRLAAENSANCDDYNDHETVYDQGHLAPNADFTGTEAMMINTYIYSNITPQHKTFNEHTWERLEGMVRMWCKKRGDLFVITGAVFDQNGDGHRDADNIAERIPPHNRVAKPTHFYKIVFNKHTFAPDESIAILLPHDNAAHNAEAWITYVSSNITTIGEIQKLTGINFLPSLSAAKRAAMENFKAPGLWPKE